MLHRENRLAGETSPYLLQHARNPVDWYPWGEEAFARARAERKPILLSVGYSACHWCHVMERESFENEETARLMNEHFVNVKVDREERPDVDEIYMNAVQLLTGRGGWPMTVFLTPEGEPFYGGTYFPPEDRHGLPGFPRVLTSVAQGWRERPDDVRRAVGRLLEGLRAIERGGGESKPLDPTLPVRAAEALSAAYDARNGGLGRAPKFPNTMVFSLFMRAWHAGGPRRLLDATVHTLHAMADGGVYDQLGGGFHRYSVDERWLVPHFEKMLYDNALLVRLYLDGWRASGEARFRAVAEDVLRWVGREMLSPEGGFYSTQDADSEGEEGKFFVWDRAEVRSLLDEREAEIFCRVYDVTDEGNFEERSILHRTLDAEQAARMFRTDAGEVERVLAAAREKLFAARERRPKPARDEKVIASWNGLMLSAYADAHRATGRAEYREVAERAFRFAEEQLGAGDRLVHSWKDGRPGVGGFLDDHAALGIAFLDLFEATFEPRHLEGAARLARRMIEDFWDEEGGGFFFTPHGHERLIARTKPTHDGSVPSGNSLAAELCLRLHAVTEEPDLLDKGTRLLELHAAAMEENPFGHPLMISALDFHLRGAKQLAVVARGGAEAATSLLGPLASRYEPNRVVFAYDPEHPPSWVPPFAREKPLAAGSPTAYVCHRFTCSPPATTWDDLRSRLEG